MNSMHVQEFPLRLRLRLTDGRVVDGPQIYEHFSLEQIQDEYSGYGGFSIVEDQHTLLRDDPVLDDDAAVDRMTDAELESMEVKLLETNEIVDRHGPVLVLYLQSPLEFKSYVRLGRERLTLMDAVRHEIAESLDEYNGDDGFLLLPGGAALYL